MADERLRMLILGAHPDDAEFHAGGLAAIYRKLGHTVKMVSVTDGGAGHHARNPAELVQVRREEAASSGRIIGATYETWGNPDGSLESTLDVRHQIIRELRTYAPDLVLTHRINDYHPDHRAVGQLVQDASFMVTVPLVVPEVPALRKDPVVAYMNDLFTKPCPLDPDIVIDITDHVDTIVAMLACHRSQVYEWLPYNQGILDQVPNDERGRLAWLREWFLPRPRKVADRFRDALIATYGPQRGPVIQFAEAYEISEYAAPLDAAARKRLFPFLP
jgi:LmbE family N-acetylglucosaminyl deacetylase